MNIIEALIIATGSLVMYLTIDYRDSLTFYIVVLAILTPYIRRFNIRNIHNLIRNDQLYLYHISVVLDEIIVPILIFCKTAYIHYTFPMEFVIHNAYLLSTLLLLHLYMIYYIRTY